MKGSEGQMEGTERQTPVGKSVEKGEPLPVLGRMYLFSRMIFRFSALTFLKPPNLNDGALSLVGHSYCTPFPMSPHAVPTCAVTDGKASQDASGPTSALKEIIKGEDLRRSQGSQMSWNLGGSHCAPWDTCPFLSRDGKDKGSNSM